MNDRELEMRIDQLRRSPLPPCPGNFESNVLRRVRLRQTQSAGAWDWLWQWIPRPSFVAATLAVVAASSLATSAIAMHAARDDKPTITRSALGFDAFNGPLHLPTDHR